MGFSDVKVHYYQSMSRFRCRRFLFFIAVTPIVCVLASVGTAQVADSTIQAKVEEHFLAAQQAQQQGRLDVAAHEYQTVLHLQPEIPEVYVNLGLVYYAQGKFEDSARALATAEKLKPGMHGVNLWLGIDLVRLNRPAQGVTLLREAVRQDPNEKLAQSWLGTALWDDGQMDAALSQLRKASSQFPDDPDLLFALGEAYGKAANQQSEQLLEDSAGTAISDRIYAGLYAAEHDWTKAEGHLRRAILRDPHSVEAHLDLAEVFLDQAQLPASLEQLEQARRMSPNSATVLARSGELRILSGQIPEGLASIEQALKFDESEALDALGLPVGDHISANMASADLLALCHAAEEKLEALQPSNLARDVALAGLYARSGDDEAAARAYRRIGLTPQIERQTKDVFRQAMDAVHQHRYEAAEAALLRWLALHPGDLSARYELVVVRRQISTTQIERLYAVAPDSYQLHQLLGQLYVARGEDDKALAEYRAAADAAPDLPDVHFWLGHLYWKHGDADHALAEFTRELQLDPGHPEANGELGAVLVAEDRAGEAIPHLESAIRSKPDLWPAYAQLGRAYAMEKSYAQAEAVLRRALAHDADASTHYQLGLVLRSDGKTAEAAQAFAKVAAIKNEKLAGPSSNNAANERVKR